MKTNHYLFILSTLLLWAIPQEGLAQKTFIHPGGLHTESDFQRMAEKVKAQETPWIQSWNELKSSSYSQHTRGSEGGYTNIGGSGNRQSAGRDAYTAYLNILRWRIQSLNATTEAERTEAKKHADNAVSIYRTWANKCTEASGELFQIPINAMVQGAELLRGYEGWSQTDFENFRKLVRTIWLPACKNFLNNCSHESWSGPAASAVMIMSVFLDDENSFDFAVNYFKGTSSASAHVASIYNLVTQDNGQIGEMGRNQPQRRTLGPASIAQLCKVAWNQETDLFSFAENRLLKGFDYYCQYNLNNPVDWTSYHWCASGEYNWFHISPSAAFRTNNSPVYEMIYNHYLVRPSLDGETVPEAPYLAKMTHLARPEEGEEGYFGFGTLTYTLDATQSPYPGCPKPGAPTQLAASLRLNSVHLEWVKPEGDVARGYKIDRSTNGIQYSQIASWDKNTGTSYTDGNVNAGTPYYYKVCATNAAGTGDYSNVVTATPTPVTAALPTGWGFADVGSVGLAGRSTHSEGSRSFAVSGSGQDVGGSADGHGYAFVKVTGDATIVARLSNVNWDGSGTWRKAGLLMRETLNAGAKRTLVGVGDNVYRHSRFGYRTSVNGGTSWTPGNDFTPIPIWFKLERTGNTFKAYQSADGQDWKLFATQTVSMHESYYVGLFACAATSSAQAITATFDEVSVTTAQPGERPALPTNFAGAATSSTTLKLSWTASPTAATYILKRAASENGPFETLSTTITGNSFEDTGLETNTEYYYSLKAANLQGESTDSLLTKARTNALAIPPKPTGLKVAASGNSYVHLQWNATGEQTQYYHIKRAASANGEYETVGTSPANSYVDVNAGNGITFYSVAIASSPPPLLRRIAGRSGILESYVI